MKALALGIMLSLAACAHTPEPPVIVERANPICAVRVEAQPLLPAGADAGPSSVAADPDASFEAFMGHVANLAEWGRRGWQAVKTAQEGC